MKGNTHTLFIPSTPDDIYQFLQDPTSKINSRKTLIQGEDVIVLVHLDTSSSQLDYEHLFSTRPIVDVVKSPTFNHTWSLGDSKVKQSAKENSLSITTSDRYMPLDDKWLKFIESLPQKHTSPTLEPIFFILPDQSICYLLLQRIGVDEDYLNVPLYLRASIPSPFVEQKYHQYQETFYCLKSDNDKAIEFTTNITIVDPITITSHVRKGSSNIFLITTLENTSTLPITINNLTTTCPYILDKPFLPLPCHLNPTDKYTFVLPVKVPIIFSEELPIPTPKKAPSKPLPIKPSTPSPALSARNSTDSKHSSFHSRFSTKTPIRSDKSEKSGSDDDNDSFLVSRPLSTKFNAPKRLSILSTSDGGVSIETKTPTKHRNSLTRYKGVSVSVGLTLMYRVDGMLGDLYVSRELRVEYKKLAPVTMKFTFPERIKCHRVFRVVFELIYQCTIERHLVLSITSVDNIKSPIYCLHPTIDIGVFTQPCTSSISVEFLPNKSGQFIFGPVQLKDINTNEIFKMDGQCKILIEP
ncbi:Trafficking protein particle complex subunit 13 C-terminal domain-containing protein [Entamoeba marina]